MGESDGHGPDDDYAGRGQPARVGLEREAGHSYQGGDSAIDVGSASQWANFGG